MESKGITRKRAIKEAKRAMKREERFINLYPESKKIAEIKAEIGAIENKEMKVDLDNYEASIMVDKKVKTQKGKLTIKSPMKIEERKLYLTEKEKLNLAKKLEQKTRKDEKPMHDEEQFRELQRGIAEGAGYDEADINSATISRAHKKYLELMRDKVQKNEILIDQNGDPKDLIVPYSVKWTDVRDAIWAEKQKLTKHELKFLKRRINNEKSIKITEEQSKLQAKAEKAEKVKKINEISKESRERMDTKAPNEPEKTKENNREGQKTILEKPEQKAETKKETKKTAKYQINPKITTKGTTKEQIEKASEATRIINKVNQEIEKQNKIQIPKNIIKPITKEKIQNIIKNINTVKLNQTQKVENLLKQINRINIKTENNIRTETRQKIETKIKTELRAQLQQKIITEIRTHITTTKPPKPPIKTPPTTLLPKFNTKESDGTNNKLKNPLKKPKIQVADPWSWFDNKGYGKQKNIRYTKKFGTFYA